MILVDLPDVIYYSTAGTVSQQCKQHSLSVDFVPSPVISALDRFVRRALTTAPIDAIIIPIL